MNDKTDHKAIREALEAGPVQYACHIDGEVQTSCTFDPGQNLYDCTLAARLSEKGLCKTDCAEWKPINAPKSTVEVSATNLRALLADLDAMHVIVLRQAVLLGEYSKSLDKDDPDHAELVEINGLIDALKGADSHE